MRRGMGNRGYRVDETIQDLDRELELLRKKRQMIQDQRLLIEQNEFSRNPQFNPSPWESHQQVQFGFNRVEPPRSYEQRQSNFNQFANLYPSKSSRPSRGNRRGTKRPANDQPNVPAKRRNDQPNVPAKRRNDQPAKSQAKPRPQASARRSDAPSKPKPRPGPAVNVPKKPDGVRAVDPKDLVLTEDRTPSSQLLGRLELAMGNLLKAVRIQYSAQPHNKVFSAEALKAIKYELRVRFHEVMLGKSVTGVSDILAEYRKVYPVETDPQLVELAFVPMKVWYAPRVKDEVQAYIKENVHKKLEKTLDDMFLKIKKMYEPENSIPTHTLMDKIFDNDDDVSVEKDVRLEKDVSVEKEIVQPKEDVEATQPDIEEVASKEKGQKKGDSFANKCEELVVQLIRKKLPVLLPKYKSCLVGIMNFDRQFERFMSEYSVDEKKTKEADTPASAALSDGIYTLKVFGVPHLPKRYVMQSYLGQHSPLTIKKHKAVNNLLIVTLSRKCDHDALLAANGTTIGKCKLLVKACQNGDKPEDKANKDSLNASSDSLPNISLDLDNDITNLLSSIRKDEESSGTAVEAKNPEEGTAELSKPDEETVEPTNSEKETVEPTNTTTNGTEPSNPEEETVEPSNGDEEIAEPSNGDEEIAEPSNGDGETAEPFIVKTEASQSNSDEDGVELVINEETMIDLTNSEVEDTDDKKTTNDEVTYVPPNGSDLVPEGSPLKNTSFGIRGTNVKQIMTRRSSRLQQ